MSLGDVNVYIDNIDPGSFQYWCAQDEAPTASEVQAFFDEIKFTLLGEFCEFASSRLSGFHIEVPEEVWPRRQGGAHWWFLYGLSVFGIGRDVPEWLDLRSQYKKFQVDSSRELLPFMRVVSDADRYCFTREGRIVHWCHETHSTTIVDESFANCLLRELRALEARKDRVIRGEMTK